MSKVLEERDKEIHDSLISTDKFWVEKMESCNHYLKSIYYEQINMGKTMGSITQRQVELIKGKVKNARLGYGNNFKQEEGHSSKNQHFRLHSLCHSTTL